MSKTILHTIINFIVYLTIQVIALKHFALFDIAFCYLYISFILFFPLSDINPALYILIGFLTGLSVDFFYNTVGIHAASCVLVAYSRFRLISFLTPAGGYTANTRPLLKEMGVRWFLKYSSLLVFIHQLTLFYLQAGTHSLFFTLLKVISSSLLTLVVLVLIQFLFYFPAKRNT